MIDKVYEVEYIVDDRISKEVPLYFLERWLFDIMEDITLIRVEIVDIKEKKMVGNIMNNDIAHTLSNLERTPRMNEEIVGFKDVIEKLKVSRPKPGEA